MLTTQCLKNLIRKLGGTPPKGNSVADCLSELCKCNFPSNAATAQSWDLSQSLTINGKEATVYNIAATQSGASLKINFNYKNASGESKSFTVYNGGSSAIPHGNIAINIIPRFDGVLLRLLNGDSTDSDVSSGAALYVCATAQENSGITETLIPAAVGEYSLTATGLSGTADVIINE